jgi:hypothetical protein
MTTIEKLNKMFIERYYKLLSDMNVSLYKAAKDDNGNFEVPVISLSSGGFTEITAPSPEAYQLNGPARVRVVNKKVKGLSGVYRIAISYSEAEIAANKPDYFNYLFDGIMEAAIAEYQKKFGVYNKVRFGEVYITAERPGRPKQPLALLTIESTDGSGNLLPVDDQVELRLYCSFASTVEA